MHERIAKALGWEVKEVQSFSLQTVRELVRRVDPALAEEISEVVRTGSHIYLPKGK